MNDDALTYAIAKAVVIIASSTTIVLCLVWIAARSSFELPFLGGRDRDVPEDLPRDVPDPSANASGPVGH